MIQAKAASTLEAECDPLQVSHPITGNTVVLSSKTSQDEDSGISVVKQEDEGVTEPEVTIRSVASTNPAEAESDLSRAGNHFLYNHLSDKFKLKTIENSTLRYFFFKFCGLLTISELYYTGSESYVASAYFFSWLSCR